MTLTYRIEMEPDDNGALLITAPAFPEVTTFSDAADQAMSRAADALEEAIAARIAQGRDIPAPDVDPAPGDASWVQMSSIVSIKAGLYQFMRLKGTTRADLQRTLGWHREQVDRVFRLDHGSRLDQLEQVARALGAELSVVLKQAA